MNRPVDDFAENLQRSGMMIADYLILREIGRGGMGSVFLARHVLMDRQVAIKVIQTRWAGEDQMVRRFYREIKLLAKLTHPNIVVAHDAGVFDGRPYLVTEWIDGEDLHRLIAERGPLPLERMLSVLRQSLDALAYAHQHGIVHRDIKPGNLIVTARDHLKLLDLGLARMVTPKHDDETRVGQVLGTPQYSAPEQASGLPSDHRADLYSLGRTMQFLLVGADAEQRGGQQGEDWANERFGMCAPRWLIAIYDRLVRFDPDDRYQSAQAVIEDLEDGTDRLPASTESLGSWPPLAPPSRTLAWNQKPSIRRPTWVTRMPFAIAGLLGIVCITIAFFNGIGFPPGGDHDGSNVEHGSDTALSMEPPLQLQRHDSQVAFVEFSPDGQYLVSGGWDGWTVLWKAGTDQVIAEIEKKDPDLDPDGILAGLFLDDGVTLLLGSSFGTVSAWNIPKQTQVGSFDCYEKSVDFMTLCELDDDQIAVGAGDAQGLPVKLFDLASPDEAFASSQPHLYGVSAIAYDSKKETLITVGWNDGVIRTRDLVRGDRWIEYNHADELTHDFVFDAPSRVLYTVHDLGVSAWHIDKSGQSLFRHNDNVQPTQFSIDVAATGPIVTGGSDGSVVLRDRHTGDELARAQAFSMPVNDVAISADGLWIAACSDESTIKTWSLKSIGH